MPELPEVERARRLAERVIRGRRIVRVWCAPDQIVFDDVSPARFGRALLNRRVSSVKRHGKHLWFELDQRPWPCFHFGMTGGFHAPRVRGVRLVSSGARDAGESWPPRFTKLRLTIEGGGELVMCDARRLGRIRLRQDRRHSRPSARLASMRCSVSRRRICSTPSRPNDRRR